VTDPMRDGGLSTESPDSEDARTASAGPNATPGTSRPSSTDTNRVAATSPIESTARCRGTQPTQHNVRHPTNRNWPPVSLNSSNFAVIATPQPSAVAHTIPVTLFDCVHGRLYLQRGPSAGSKVRRRRPDQARLHSRRRPSRPARRHHRVAKDCLVERSVPLSPGPPSGRSWSLPWKL